MQNALLTKFISKNKREKEFPEFRPGDTIKVHVKIKEGEKERLQAFEGVLIARNGMGMGESITVRKVSFGQGVERIFPVHAKVWITPMWSAWAVYAAPSFTICAP